MLKTKYYILLFMFLLAVTSLTYGQIVYTAGQIKKGGNSYATLNAAIAAAVPGDTIIVGAGTYNHSSLVNINKANLFITGAGAVTAIINYNGAASTNGTFITISAAGVKIEGLTFTASSVVRYGIKASGPSLTGINIDNIIVQNFYRSGMDFNGIVGLTISNIISMNNGGAGLFFTDVKGANLSDISTSGNPWGGMGFSSRGQTHPAGIEDIVISGINSFGESSSKNGGMYLEMSRYQGTGTVEDSVTTFSSNPADNADVTFQLGDFAYAISGVSSQTQDDDADGDFYYMVRFYKTLQNTLDAIAASPDHYVPANSFIINLNNNTAIVPPGSDSTGSLQNAITYLQQSGGDTLYVDPGTYNGNPVNLNVMGLTIIGNNVPTSRSARTGGRASITSVPGPTVPGFVVAANNVSIINFNVNNPAGAGITNSVPVSNLYLELIAADNTLNDGAQLTDVATLTIVDCSFDNSQNNSGLVINNSIDIVLDNVSASGNQVDGFAFKLINNLYALDLLGNSNIRYGLNLGESDNTEFENGTFDFNLDGLHIHPHWDSDVNASDFITNLYMHGTWSVSNNTNRGIVLQSDGAGLNMALNSTAITNPLLDGTFTVANNGAGGVNIFGNIINPELYGFSFTGPSSYGVLITGLNGMLYQPTGVTINNSSFDNYGSSWPDFAVSLSDYVSKYSTNDVDAEYNLWNGSPVPNVESIVWHKNDDAALGLVITGQVLLSYPANNSLGHPLLPRLEWFAHTPAVSYTIQVADNADFSSPTEYTVSAPLLAFDIPDTLLNNTRYYWRVRALETAAPVLYSAWSNPWNFKTTATGLSGVQIPQLINPVNNFNVFTLTPTLSWTTYQAGITSYQLQYTMGDTSALMVSTPIFVPSAGGFTSYVLPTLMAGEDYLWRVRSYNASTGIYSGWSVPFRFTIDASQGPTVPYPSYPVNTTVYTNYPTLYWYTLSAATGIMYDVELERLTPSPVTIPLVNNINLTGLFYLVDVNELVHDDSLLVAGNYQWRVTAHKPGYSFTSAWAPFTISGIAINIPAKPIISWPRDGAMVYTTTPVLNWYTGATNINNIVFDWEISTSSSVVGSGAFTSTVDFGTNNYAPAVSGVGPLNDGTLYYWHVRSRNTVTSVVSDWSDTESFLTSGIGGGVPASPSLIWPANGDLIYTLTPTLTWAVPLNSGTIANYRVEISSEDNPDFVTFRFIDTGAPVTNSYLVPPGALINGVTYYWRVSASYTGPAGPWGAPSAVGSFTTIAGTAPVVPIAANPVYGSIFRVESPALSWFLPVKGEAMTYELQYSTKKDFSNAVTIEGLDKPAYDLSDLPAGQYYWRVRSKNSNGEYSFYSGRNEFRIGNSVTAVEKNENIIPSKFEVAQNYPNPFNPSTTIQFAVPEVSKVSVKIYDMLGREIKTLLDEDIQAGIYRFEWNGDNNSGQKVASGTYIYRVVAGSNVKTMKMVLLK